MKSSSGRCCLDSRVEQQKLMREDKEKLIKHAAEHNTTQHNDEKKNWNKETARNVPSIVN